MRRASIAVPAVFAAALPCAVQAQDAKPDPREAIDEKGLSLEWQEESASPTAVNPPDGGGESPTLILDQIINIAQKIWKIIEDNKPIVDVKNQYAVAVPVGTTNWTQLAGWKPPKGDVYQLTAKNGYGTEVVKIRYQVLRTYGGSAKGGKGRYLTGVTVEPLRVEVAWKYKVTVRAEVPESSVVNAGTHEDPVAAMIVKLTWRIETPIKDSQGSSLYYVTGDGQFVEVGKPFAQARAQGIASRVGTALQSTLP